jgi:hypothetical protein
MKTADHMDTKSWGNGAEAEAYTQAQAELIKQGNLRQAIQNDIDDIRRISSMYEEGIHDVIRYFEGQGIKGLK